MKTPSGLHLAWARHFARKAAQNPNSARHPGEPGTAAAKAPPPSNLHPAWMRYCELEWPDPDAPGSAILDAAGHRMQLVKASEAPPAGRPYAEAVKAATSFHVPPSEAEGWEPTSTIRPAFGAPVAVKKRLSANVWISGTVLPGDARYPKYDYSDAASSASST
ncbi:hypothetical protein OOT46_22850 [Aquabacterium sp. A7-Y]|uniref:hypothetical protein n=1 Tax=Aquabacterium sp. A7-Y TaxID=1349605 RepID=UPI00223CCB48|nr:hypothetical protein [Aquabacterium sp. A7-Y]MCW7540662.1 hypothetical protein [Aquabacterium sp. A7-Y]